MSAWGFHSFIGAVQSEELLRSRGKHGSFLCRRSRTTPGAYTLSVRMKDTVWHYRIQNDGEVFHLYEDDGFASVPELIDYYKKHPSQFIDKNQNNVELIDAITDENDSSQLENESWFYGKISAEEARQLLMNGGQNGSFLIRESRTRPGNYVLSIRKMGKVIEFIINHERDGFAVASSKRIKFPTLEELLKYCKKNPLVHAQLNEALELTEPLSITAERKRDNAYIKSEFEMLQREDKVNTASKFEGERPENKKKNRYKNILPFDKTRVKLKNVDPNTIGSDYINASYVVDHYTGKTYIAAQGCTKITVHHFWQMLSEQNCRVVIMLTKEIENSKLKCVKYWPESGESLYYDNKQITCVSETRSRDYSIRELQISETEVNSAAPPKPSRKTIHIQFLEWPDHGVPEDPGSLLEMLDRANSAQLTFSNPGPMVIHCSAGIGRTGTVLALDILLNHLTEKGNLNSVDVPGVVEKIRTQRSGMIQTEMQYRFLSIALQRHVEVRKRLISSIKNEKSVYSNTEMLRPLTHPLHQAKTEEPLPPPRSASLDSNRSRTTISKPLPTPTKPKLY